MISTQITTECMFQPIFQVQLLQHLSLQNALSIKVESVFFHIKIHALTLSYLIVNKLQQMPQQNFAMERTVYNEEFFFYYIPRYPHRELSGDLPIAEKTGSKFDHNFNYVKNRSKQCKFNTQDITKTSPLQH